LTLIFKEQLFILLAFFGNPGSKGSCRITTTTGTAFENGFYHFPFLKIKPAFHGHIEFGLVKCVAAVNPGRFAAPGITENQFAIFQIIFGDIETTGQPNPFFDFYQLTVFK
jgi:hypothetical protein